MMRALASMGKDEIQSIIEEQGKVEVTCEFCKDAVTFTEADLLGAKDEV
jgi:molecular chaperone Hsp33